MSELKDYFSYDFLSTRFPGDQLNFERVKKHLFQYCKEKDQIKDTASLDTGLSARINEVFNMRAAEEIDVNMKSLIPSNRKDGDTFLSPIYLEWIDSAGYHGWQTAQDAQELEPYFCRTFGLLLREDEHAFIIVQTENYGIGIQFSKMFDGVQSIPKCAVTKEIRYAIHATEDEGHAD